MRSSLLRDIPARKDHHVVARIIESCKATAGGGGLRIGVCNEAGSVYLAIETGNDEEFIEVMASLALLGFTDVAAPHAPHDTVMRKAD